MGGIELPGILQGGQTSYPEAMRGLALEVKSFGKAIAGVSDTIQANYDYNDSMSLKNEYDENRNQHHMEFITKDDGSDPKAFDRYKQEAQEIDKEYIDKAYQVNNRVGGFIEKYSRTESARMGDDAQQQLYNKFLKKSLETDNLQVDNDTRWAINTGEIHGALSRVQALAKTREPIYGAANSAKIAVGHSAYVVENAIKGIMADPAKAPSFLKRFETEPTYKQSLFQHLPATKIDEMEKLISAGQAKSTTLTAYAEITNAFTDKKTGKIDYKAAASAVLSPEFAQKHNLTIDQQQNISQSLNLRYSAEETARKDLQEKNMESLYKLATTQPGKAIERARTLAASNDGSVDPKDLYNFQKALESHIKQTALMSAQEKQIRLDLEDKAKAAIKVNVLGGAYKSEKELVNAVLAAGFSNSSEVLSQSLEMFRKERKENFGQVNNFKNAQEDWDLLIRTTKSPTMKRELSDKKTEMENTLAGWMLKNNIQTTDPKVTEQYKIIRQNLTETWLQRQINKVKETVGVGAAPADTFVKPKDEATMEVYPAGTKRHRINPQTKQKESQEWNGKEWVPITGR